MKDEQDKTLIKKNTTNLIRIELDLYHIHINVSDYFKKRYNCSTIKTHKKFYQN